MSAATTGQDEQGLPEQADQTNYGIIGLRMARLWFVPLFSVLVLLFTLGMLPIDGYSEMPPGQELFWGAMLILSAIYSIRRTPDVLEG